MKKSIVASLSLAACAAFTTYAGGVISINLTVSGGKTVSGPEAYGLESAVGDSWCNVTAMGSAADPQHFTVLVKDETRDGEVMRMDNAVSVTFATDASDSPFQRYYQASIHGDDDSFMYNYLNDNGNITVDVANVPYKAYKVILYVGADWAGSTGGWDEEGPDFNPIQVNGTYYRYDSEQAATVKCGTGAENCWGKYASGTAEEGRNALVTPVQYGSPLRIYVPKCWAPRRSALCAFQIVEAEGELKPIPGAISVNFVDSKHEWNGDDPEGEPHKWRDTRVAQIGLINDVSGGWLRAESWNNAEYKSDQEVGGTMKLKVWNGADNPITEADQSEVTLTWSAGDTYFLNSPVPVDNYLRGYLADGSEPSVSVSGIPYDEYDLIVYLAADWGGSDGSRWTGPDFNPVKVNGVSYTWSAEDGKTVQGATAWGQVFQPSAQLGVNALRISGLTGGELQLSAGTAWGPRRGGIAAFQIVKPLPADLVAEDSIAAKDVNSAIRALHKVGADFSLELPAGKSLVLDAKRPLVCSRLNVTCKGNVLVDTASYPFDDSGELLDWVKAELLKVNVSAVKGMVFHGWKMTGRVISVNVYSEKGEMARLDGFAGAFAGEEIPASSWNDMPAANMTGEAVSPKAWNGSLLSSAPITGLTMTWDFVNVYGWGTAPEQFRRGWLTNGGHEWSISFAGIPFDKYDVICYFNWDGTAPFWANKINGAYYIGDESGVAQESVSGGTWGMSGHSEAAKLGVNAYRLANLTSPTLTLAGGWMANLCAIQIVEPAPKRRYLEPGLVVTIR